MGKDDSKRTWRNDSRNVKKELGLEGKGETVGTRKVGDRKPCLSDDCEKEAVCIAAYTDYCMGTLDEIEMAEWECECGAWWKQGNPVDE